MDERIGPRLPVRLGEDFDLVPGPSLEAGPTAAERDEPELAPSRAQVVVQMGRVHCRVWTPLAHRRRLGGDVEGEAPRRVPGSDGLDERAGRELAVPDRADARAVDARAHRIGDAAPEIPLRGWWQLAEADDVPPHHLRRRADLQHRRHLPQARPRGLGGGQERQHQYEDARVRPRLRVLQRDHATDAGAEHGERNRQWQRHAETHDPFEREQEECAAGGQHARDREADRRVDPPRTLAVGEEAAQRTHHQRGSEEERAAVSAEDEDAGAEHQEGHRHGHENGEHQHAQMPPHGCAVTACSRMARDVA